MEYKEILTTIAFVAILLVIYYFSTWQQKKQAKLLKKMQEEIKENDKIITFSGLSGKVVSTSKDYVVVQLHPDDTKVTIERWAIAEIDQREYEGSDEKNNENNDQSEK